MLNIKIAYEHKHRLDEVRAFVDKQLINNENFCGEDYALELDEYMSIEPNTDKTTRLFRDISDLLENPPELSWAKLIELANKKADYELFSFQHNTDELFKFDKYHKAWVFFACSSTYDKNKFLKSYT